MKKKDFVPGVLATYIQIGSTPLKAKYQGVLTAEQLDPGGTICNPRGIVINSLSEKLSIPLCQLRLLN